jgi:hypothetical protein
MKLSVLLTACIAVSSCLAQTSPKPAVAFPAPKADSGNITVQIPPQVWSELQKLPPAEMQRQPQAIVRVTSDRNSQEGCPVVLTSAGLAPYLMLLREGGEEGKSGGIDLEFRNASGRAIGSMEFTAHLIAKRSKYDLGGSSVFLNLTAYGSRSIDSTFTELRRLSLPENIHPVIVEDIALRQVIFEDGSVWAPEKDRRCRLSPGGAWQIGSR